ncbi:MAG: hypothetical protein HY744_10385 [Deltaproteobacteria bacterium]|nr:hypothetical protein [Deltaproteobacteria bacterium]
MSPSDPVRARLSRLLSESRIEVEALDRLAEFVRRTRDALPAGDAEADGRGAF